MTDKPIPVHVTVPKNDAAVKPVRVYVTPAGEADNKPVRVYVTNPDESLTVAEFCKAEHISLATFYKMKRAGYGPDEIRIPGTNVVRVTAAARTAWQQRMQQQQHSKAAKVEAKRRQKQTSEAGRLAAQSPLHVQRRKGRRS